MEKETFMDPAEALLSRRRLLKMFGLGACAATLGALSGDDVEAHEAAAPPIEAHVNQERREIRQPTDILRGFGPWTYMDGAKLTDKGLELSPTHLAIVDKRVENEFVTQPNPPFNAYGPHLETNGDFAVNWKLHSDNRVALQLYGQVPLRFDDFRFERGRVEVTPQNDQLHVRVWDGTSQEPTEHTFMLPPSADTSSVAVRRVGSDVIFYVHNDEVGRLPHGHIFDSGTVFMGMNSESGPATIKHLKVRPLHGSKLQVVNTASLRVTKPVPGGLQTLVKRPDFTIGSAVSLNQIASDMQYAQLNFGQEIGSLTPENALKPQDTQPTEGVFTLGAATALVKLAERHHMEIHGHAAMYAKALPQWMRELPTESEADKQRLRDVLQTHVKTIVGAFKGRIATWDVYNEIIDGFNEQAAVRDDSPFFKGLGEECIEIALRAAHEADPNCKLFLNDYGLETNLGRAQAMLGLVQRLLLKGVPLHGIGIQGHVYELPRDEIKPENLALIMTTTLPLGLEVHVSELDVTGANGDQPQAEQYSSTLNVALRSPNCRKLTTWVLTDRYGSTTQEAANQLIPGNSLIYDTDYKPKPARQAMANVLNQPI